MKQIKLAKDVELSTLSKLRKTICTADLYEFYTQEAKLTLG